MIRICADSGGNPHAADGQSPRCSAHRAQRKRYTDTACQRRKRRLPQVEYRPEPSPFGPEARVLSDEDVAYLDDLLDLVRIALVPLNLASRRHLPYSRGDVDALLSQLDELLIVVQERISAPSRLSRRRSVTSAAASTVGGGRRRRGLQGNPERAVRSGRGFPRPDGVEPGD